MRARPILRGLVATVAVAVVLLTAGGRAHATFRCGSDAVVREVCCCPPAAEAAHDAISRSCCCEIGAVRAADVSTARPDAERAGLGRLHEVVVATFVIAEPPAPGPVAAPAARLEAHPPAPPPLILLKQSFLL